MCITIKERESASKAVIKSKEMCRDFTSNLVKSLGLITHPHSLRPRILHGLDEWQRLMERRSQLDQRKGIVFCSFHATICHFHARLSSAMNAIKWLSHPAGFTSSTVCFFLWGFPPLRTSITNCGLDYSFHLDRLRVYPC